MNHLVVLSANDISQKIQDYVDQALQLLSGNGFVDVIIQLGATLILFLAVRFLLWNKMTAILEKRKANFENAMKEKDDALLKAKETKEETEKMVLEAKKESAEIIELAKERSYKEAEKILDEAKEEAKSIVTRAQNEVEAEIAKANDEIKNEIIDTAFLMAKKIAEKEIKAEDHQELINSFLKDSDKND